MLASIALLARTDSDSRAQTLAHVTQATVLDSSLLQAQLWRAAEVTTAIPPGYSALSRAVVDTMLSMVGPRRGRLSPFEATLFDYVSAINRGDPGGMLAALRQMQELAPDVILARNRPNRLLDVNRPREALALLLHARPTRGLDGQLEQPSESPLRWATLADVYHYLGDHRAERDAAAQLRRVRPDQPLSVRYQLKAAAALGDSAEVERLLADARLLPAPAQTYEFLGDLELQTGQELEAHHQVAFGQALVRRSIEWFEAQPLQERTWRMRIRHAIAYHELGDEERANAVLQTVPAVLDSTNLLYVGLRGRIAASRRDTMAARLADSALAARGRGMGGANTLERAFIAADLGQRDRAVTLLQESFAQGYGFTIRWRLHWLTDTRSLRGYPPFEQLLQPQG
jgi:tetratricopeptide (TPR) repeat protein